MVHHSLHGQDVYNVGFPPDRRSGNREGVCEVKKSKLFFKVSLKRVRNVKISCEVSVKKVKYSPVKSQKVSLKSNKSQNKNGQNPFRIKMAKTPYNREPNVSLVWEILPGMCFTF